MATEIIFVFI